MAQRVGRWLAINMSWVQFLYSRNNLGQVVHTYVPLSPSSITWYRPRGSAAGKVTAGMAKKWQPTAGWMTYSHLRADRLYTGISPGPNARQRVWKAFTFLCGLSNGTSTMTLSDFEGHFNCLKSFCLSLSGNITHNYYDVFTRKSETFVVFNFNCRIKT